MDATRLLSFPADVLTVPEGYTLTEVQNQKQNGVDVLVYRHTKSSGENRQIGGEHFSVVVEKDSNKLLGFTWMDQQFSTGELPSQEATRAISREFLDKLEPGLFDRLKNLWIDIHDEIITLKNTSSNESMRTAVTGMKYKCYLEEQNDYAWVIVGPGGKVITFEQEIIWNNGRVTEKWLHDSWLATK